MTHSHFERPTPETLLKKIQDQEESSHSGQLKIYLGAAPGVGKTYTMLQDALKKRQAGLDVVIGIAESHGREAIERLIKNFEILPPKKVIYHELSVLEFDLQAAIKRNPALIIIDELAHTNTGAGEHKKRWQDVKQILEQGIDVYTTLNVQHVESLNDIVSQILQVRVQETVPDTVLDLASTIALVDLPPEDLLKRLHEGKIYVPSVAHLAKEKFFREGNLSALRELALRVTAEHVETEALLYRRGQAIQHIWPVSERLLVCVGPGMASIQCIHTARRWAQSLRADWMAIHVEAPRQKLSAHDKQSILHNLHVAEQLGARTQILKGTDIVKEVIKFARLENITQIILRKNIRSRFYELFHPDLSHEIIRQSGEINVYIVSGMPYQS